jgi:hypothetical protein
MAIDEHTMEEPAVSGLLYLGAAHFGAVAAAGLRTPRIGGLGDIRVAHLRHEVRP